MQIVQIRKMTAIDSAVTCSLSTAVLSNFVKPYIIDSFVLLFSFFLLQLCELTASQPLQDVPIETTQKACNACILMGFYIDEVQHQR